MANPARMYGGFQGFQGITGAQGTQGPVGLSNPLFTRVDEIYKFLPQLGINIEKVFAMSSDSDKNRIFIMYDEMMNLLSSSWTEATMTRIVLIYNTLYRGDYLTTNREQKLLDILE